MAGYPGYVSCLRGFDASNYYVGANGQMAGGPTFTAGALFSLTNLVGATHVVWANLNPAAFQGWAIDVVLNAGNPAIRALVGDGANVNVVGPVNVPVGWLLHVFLVVGDGALSLYLNGSLVATATEDSIASVLAPTVGVENSGAPTSPAFNVQVHGLAYDSTALGQGTLVDAFFGATSSADMTPQLSEDLTPVPDFTNRYSVRNGVLVPGQYAFDGDDGEQPPPAAIWTPQAGPISLTRVGGDLFTRSVTRMEFATPPPLPVIIL
jgi:hypothetical protein